MPVQYRLLCAKSNATRIRRARCRIECRKLFVHSMSRRMYAMQREGWMQWRWIARLLFNGNPITVYNWCYTWLLHVQLLNFSHYCVPTKKVQGKWLFHNLCSIICTLLAVDVSQPQSHTLSVTQQICWNTILFEINNLNLNFNFRLALSPYSPLARPSRAACGPF